MAHPFVVYSGFSWLAFPHIQARMNNLQNRYNNAKSGEEISLEGQLLLDADGNPFLGWEFGLHQPIKLTFKDYVWKSFLQKGVRVTGQKYYVPNLRRNSTYGVSSSFFHVSSVEEHSFPWNDSLGSYLADIPAMDGFLTYSIGSSTINDDAFRAFILSLIGTGKLSTNSASGVGLSSFIPTGTSLHSFSPILDSYVRLDPFHDKSVGQFDRFSKAFLSTNPQTETVVRRALPNQNEVDYLLGTQPGVAKPIVEKIISENSELLTMLGEQGLQTPSFHKKEQEKLKFDIFCINKCITPSFTEEGKTALEAARIILDKWLNTKWSLPIISEMSSFKKLENIVIALAKSNHRTEIGAKEVDEAVNLYKSSLESVMWDKEVFAILKKKEESLEEITKSDLSWRRMNNARVRIVLRLGSSLVKKDKLIDDLVAVDGLDEKAVVECLSKMLKEGTVYEYRPGELKLA